MELWNNVCQFMDYGINKNLLFNILLIPQKTVPAVLQLGKLDHPGPDLDCKSVG